MATKTAVDETARYFSMHSPLLVATIALLERDSKEPVFTAQILDALEERGVRLRSAQGKPPGSGFWARLEALTDQGIIKRTAYPGPGRGAINYAWRTTAAGRKYVAKWNELLRSLKVHTAK